MPTIIDWPSSLRPNNSVIPWIEGNVASAGASLTGQERVIQTDAGRWRYGFTVPIRTRNHALAWRALTGLTEGRAHLIRVPICDGLFDPAAVAGVRSALVRDYRNGLPHGDGALFDDGAGYAAALTTATAYGNAGAGATSITLDMPTGLRPDPGQFFSDGDRFYKIKTATLVSGTRYTLTFVPRLRAAITNGTELSFDRLSCLMRFSDDGVLRTDLASLRYGEIAVEFVEVLL